MHAGTIDLKDLTSVHLDFWPCEGCTIFRNYRRRNREKCIQKGLKIGIGTRSMVFSDEIPQIVLLAKSAAEDEWENGLD